MYRLVVGAVMCVVVAAAVEITGVGRMLPLDRVVPPPVPEQWAALPPGGRVELVLVRSDELVKGLAMGLSRSEVAMKRPPGAVALVDGRVFTISVPSARSVLEALSWERLPMTVSQLDTASTTLFAAPEPAPLAWIARRDAYAGLKSAREWALAHQGFTATALVSAILLLLHALLTGLPKWQPRKRALDAPVSAWRRRRGERPVRVVLVPDATALAQLRTAIGEDNVVAATEHAFAFADGWILAARKGSVFELMSELGWRMRPLEMATRSELVSEGFPLSPLPSDDGGDTLGVLEALHVCGPVAHGGLRRGPLAAT
jgi:hypothetical protein